MLPWVLAICLLCWCWVSAYRPVPVATPLNIRGSLSLRRAAVEVQREIDRDRDKHRETSKTQQWVQSLSAAAQKVQSAFISLQRTGERVRLIDRGRERDGERDRESHREGDEHYRRRRLQLQELITAMKSISKVRTHLETARQSNATTSLAGKLHRMLFALPLTLDDIRHINIRHSHGRVSSRLFSKTHVFKKQPPIESDGDTTAHNRGTRFIFRFLDWIAGSHNSERMSNTSSVIVANANDTINESVNFNGELSEMIHSAKKKRDFKNWAIMQVLRSTAPEPSQAAASERDKNKTEFNKSVEDAIAVEPSWIQHYFPFAFGGPKPVNSFENSTDSENSMAMEVSIPHVDQTPTSPELDDCDDNMAQYLWPFHNDYIPHLLSSMKYNGASSNPVNFSMAQPNEDDFNYLATRKFGTVVHAGMNIRNRDDFQDFLKAIGLTNLKLALKSAPLSVDRRNHEEEYPYDKQDVVKVMLTLLMYDPTLGRNLLDDVTVIDSICELLETPFNFFFLRAKKDLKTKGQLEAIQLLYTAVRNTPGQHGDELTMFLQQHKRLQKALIGLLGCEDDAIKQIPMRPVARFLDSIRQNVSTDSVISSLSSLEAQKLSLQQMTRVTAARLGLLPWKPRQKGQKGLRILSLDGGGTRGVLSIALLKELFDYAYSKSKFRREPFETFDLICGTSTGGIIAVLLGLQRGTIEESELLYDTFVEKIFAYKSNLKFVRKQAFYDESVLESLLHDICQDELLIDSVADSDNCPRVFCVSSAMHSSPPQVQLWRNYEYPATQSKLDRYSGNSRIPTKTAIRATTAAPTFFTPVHWRGEMFCDGALVANNPTAIAIQEAKRLFPQVPIECVVSIGTGLFIEKRSNATSVGLDTLLNNLIASTTDTEDVHNVLQSLLPPESYFRFNPTMKSNVRIDEKSKTALSGLKVFAKEWFSDLMKGPEAKNLLNLVKLLQAE